MNTSHLVLYLSLQEGQDYDIANGSGADDGGFPSKVTEGTEQTDSGVTDTEGGDGKFNL